MHKKVRIRHNDFEDDFDEEIAPLVETLWKLDISVIDGCQEVEPGWIFLEFLSSVDLENFLTIVGHPDDSENSIYRRIQSNEGEGRWEYNCLVSNFGSNNFHAHLYMRFPKSDFDEVNKRVELYASQKSSDLNTNLN